MTATEIITELRRRGVELIVEGEQLRVRAAQGTLTSELREQIAQLKTVIMGHLREERAPVMLLTPTPEQRFDPFPLTDVQEAYLVGQTGAFGIGEVACHLYHEFDARGLDVERLSRAWQRLIDYHEMLRSIVLPGGEQRILDDPPPYSVEVLDLRGQQPKAVETQLEALRHRMSTRMTQPGQWPTFELRATLLDGGRTRIHFDFALITADASGLLLLLEQWRELYKNPEHRLPPLSISFRDYVLAEMALRSTAAYKEAEQYWHQRLLKLPPPPALPLATSPDLLQRPPFRRLSGRLAAEQWSRLKALGAEQGLTPSGVICAAYAMTLAAWSENAHFTLNLTLFRHLPLHPEVERLVGDFTTTVLLEVNGRDDSFLTLARRLRDQLNEDMEHAQVSGIEVMRQLAHTQDGAPNAMPVVFTSLLGHRSAQPPGDTLLSWLGEVVYAISQTPQVWLDHQVREESGMLLFSWDSPIGLFPEGLLEAAFGAYARLLTCLAEDQTAWEDKALLLLPAEQAVARQRFNDTSDEMMEERLDALFLAAAARAPERTALIAPDAQLTYGELQRRAALLAAQLGALGVRPETLVAVSLDKGWRQVVAVLAIHLAGAAYLPLDPALPQERRWLLIEEGRVEVVLTDPAPAEQLEWPQHVRVLPVDDLWAGEAASPLTNRSATDLAYCIYTSGSTGRPKGVMIEHQAAANTLCDINRRFLVGPDDRVFALSSLSFDLSVYDVFGTLAAGAAIVMPEPEAVRDPARWLALLAAHQVTVWNSVPPLMEMLVETAESRREPLPSSLRLVLLSGDWIPTSLPDRIRVLCPQAQVISLGGATEASVWSILHVIESCDALAHSIPYGRPMTNQRFYVLDEQLVMRPDYVPGELFIGGVGLARGYWRDDALTQERFITHPRTGERLYRTGDMGRFLPNGNIEFLGRRDFQVKVAGHRIELGEIEATLLRHPAVREAVVAAPGERGQRRLVAYVVLSETAAGHSPTAQELREFLRDRLPEYMVPATCLFLSTLPLSSNGKIDRKALQEPPPMPEALPQRAGADAIDPLLVRITELVCDAVKRTGIRPEDSLFQIGASSIDLIRLATRLKEEFGFRPPMGEFFKLKNGVEIAAYYREHQRTQSAVGERAGEDEAGAVPLILDLEEREAFKAGHRGWRQFATEHSAVALVAPTDTDASERSYRARASHRTFASDPLKLDALGRLLSCLRPITVGGKLKYQYGSAGGSYSVQAYLHVAPGRIRGLDAGAYYYDPGAHRLVELTATGPLLPEIHLPVNRPLFEQSAFSLFLVCQSGAILPLYGEKWRDYALIEAGLVAQLLEMRASEQHIGLCQIGEVQFDDLRELFLLEEAQAYLHSLVGGPLAWEEGVI